MEKQKVSCPFCGVEPHAKHGFVYAIIFHGSIVKIGRSDNPSLRVAQHKARCALPVKEGFLFAVEDAVRAERVLLEYFRFARFAAINGAEWFWLPQRCRAILNRKKFTLNGQTFWKNTCNKHCPACKRSPK